MSVSNTGTYEISAKYEDATIDELATIKLNEVEQTISDKSVISADPTYILANGSSSTTLSVSIKDSAGEPVKNLSSSNVEFTISPSTGASLSKPIASSTVGTFETTMKASTAQSYTISFKYNGTEYSSVKKIVQAKGADQGQSTISRDNSSYELGKTITITITLKADSKEGINGIGSQLTSSTVTVSNSTANTSSWTDNGDGTYSSTYTAKTAGKSLSATLKLPDWSASQSSSSFEISQRIKIVNGEDITCSTVSDYLKDNDQIEIYFADARHAYNVCIPSAAENTGKIVTVRSVALYKTTITANNTTYEMKGSHIDNSYKFTSNGTTWDVE